MPLVSNSSSPQPEYFLSSKLMLHYCGPMEPHTAAFPSAPLSWESRSKRGFTLIELSIVLVVIGLLVGGVLLGRDLIKASEARATIAQINSYSSAVNTFRTKYDALPGDINGKVAVQLGLSVTTRNSYYPFFLQGSAGIGDNNGVIEGSYNVTCPNCNGSLLQSWGETILFWQDLASSNLIGNDAGCPVTGGPMAKIGQGSCFYVYSGGTNGGDGQNYFGLSAVTAQSYCTGCITSQQSVTVSQAQAIDSKIDDGLPQSGRVTAQFLNTVSYNPLYAVRWAGTNNGYGSPYTTATPGSSTTCFDNNNVGGNPQQYSITQNNGAGINCALSFKFQ